MNRWSSNAHYHQCFFNKITQRTCWICNLMEDMQPLSIVESSAFHRLISSICPYQLPDQKSFTQHLDNLYDMMVRKVQEVLELVDGVSTTDDIWTAHHHSFLGMTVHWIDKDSLKWCKAVIACVKITRRYTYNVIASKIEHIHASYGLNGKVVGTITDNGSNFVKAFSLYSVSSSSCRVCWSCHIRRFRSGWIYFWRCK